MAAVAPFAERMPHALCAMADMNLWGCGGFMGFENVEDYWSTSLEKYLRKAAWIEQANMCGMLTLCESPIEKMLAIALRFTEFPIYGGGDNRPVFSPGGYVFDEHLISGVFREKDMLVVYPQYKIGRYRADFALFAKFYNGPHAHRLVIECDGHDFHEKSKAQAARDKKRDRELVTAGFQIFRFTGSEVFGDADACAQEIAEYLSDRFWEVENLNAGAAA